MRKFIVGIIIGLAVGVAGASLSNDVKKYIQVAAMTVKESFFPSALQDACREVPMPCGFETRIALVRTIEGAIGRRMFVTPWCETSCYYGSSIQNIRLAAMIRHPANQVILRGYGEFSRWVTDPPTTQLASE